jgi:4-amino-4-deoxychorismate lyase
MTKSPIIHINGQPSAQISALDRGFAYGDGFFETCRVYKNKIHLWDLHLTRLQDTARRLLIPIDLEFLQRCLENILQDNTYDNASLKIQITRGETQRGYAFPENLAPNYTLFLAEANPFLVDNWLDGVKVRVCDLTLSSNPALAGLKHLNRLENILARAEWKNEFAEGLLLDQTGHLIEATMSNIFLVKNRQLITPDLRGAGVAGVMRSAIMNRFAAALSLSVVTQNLTLDDLKTADEIFLCNSLIGIWPVISVDKMLSLKPGDITRQLQTRLIDHVAG